MNLRRKKPGRLQRGKGAILKLQQAPIDVGIFAPQGIATEAVSADDAALHVPQNQIDVVDGILDQAVRAAVEREQAAVEVAVGVDISHRSELRQSLFEARVAVIESQQ